MSECECMSMNPGATIRPRGIDHAVCGRLGQRSGPTASIRSPRIADIALEPGVAGPVDDLAAADQDVERLGPLFLAECGGAHRRRGE